MIKEKNHYYLNHRKRIKQKYLLKGIEDYFDYELLEFALFYAIARKDTKPIAKKLIERFKTFDRVLDANINELTEIKGISEHTAIYLKLLKDISIRYFKSYIIHKNVILSPQSAFDYLKIILKGSHNERLHVLFLNTRNFIIADETISIGTINQSEVYPRKIVERALYHHAKGVIIAHNHPSGFLEPSEEDIKTTISIKQALNTLDINLIDHILIAGTKYYSWKENNLL